jgi:hypothetical protein
MRLMLGAAAVALVVGTTSAQANPQPGWWPRAAAFDASGRVLVAGWKYAWRADPYGWWPVVQRFGARGAPDPTFAAPVLSPQQAQASAVAPTADGGAVVALDVMQAAVVRVRADGSLAGTFPLHAGQLPLVTAIAVGRGGSILVAGAGRDDSGSFAFVERLRPDGQPDPGFARGGVARIRPLFRPRSLVLARDGSLVVAGAEMPTGAVVAWLRANGTLVRTHLFRGAGAAYAALTADGGVVVLSGALAEAATERLSTSLARLDRRGRVVAARPGAPGAPRGLAVQPGGGIVVLTNRSLARFRPSLRSDATFAPTSGAVPDGSVLAVGPTGRIAVARAVAPATTGPEVLRFDASGRPE